MFAIIKPISMAKLNKVNTKLISSPSSLVWVSVLQSITPAASKLKGLWARLKNQVGFLTDVSVNSYGILMSKRHLVHEQEAPCT